MDKSVLLKQIKKVISAFKKLDVQQEDASLGSIIDEATNLYHFTNENWVDFHNKASVLKESNDKKFKIVVKNELVEMLKQLQHKIESGSAMKEEPFAYDLLSSIPDSKIETLCREFNDNFGKNPNAVAMLFRTILLNTLRYKLKKTPIGNIILKDSGSLKEILNKCISNDIFKDPHIKKFLEQFSKVPKDIYDAGVHSDWIIVEQSNLDSQISGLVLVIKKTFES